MSNSFKNTWWIFLLIAAGGIFLFLSLYSDKPQSDQGMVLNDIFHQQIAKTGPGNTSAVSPVNGHEAGFTIQVYSFQDRNMAEAALQALRNSGYQAFLVMSDLGQKGDWYRVRVGGIANEAAARKMLGEIRKNYNSGFILKP
jgi:cell division septation protein DedD